MKITPTRVNTTTLAPLAKAVAAELDRIDATLSTELVVLTADDRRSVPRTRAGFPAAARTFADVVATHPAIGLLTGFDAASVTEDLDNVALIDPLIPRLKALVRRLEDSRLRWLAEAQEPVLAAYVVAKVRAERDGALAAMIEPLQKVFANGPATAPADDEADAELATP